MQSFRITAIPTEVAESVRASKDGTAFGFPIHAEVATDAAPCRHCLRLFKTGSDRWILFTYDRFAGVEKLPQPGPVYIHAEPCRQYPAEAVFPPELRESPRTLEAYARGRQLVAHEYGAKETFELLIQKLLARPEVDYIHVNSTGAGCFTFRIDRA